MSHVKSSRVIRSLKINHIPHPSLLRGENFKRPSDAIAEFLDNPIQAGGTKVIISFHFGNYAQDSFMVIFDNGCGMDPDEMHGAICSPRF